MNTSKTVLTGIVIVLLLSTGTASTSALKVTGTLQALTADYREIGTMVLPYATGNQLVHIEDISPDYDSTSAGGSNKWGLINALSASGPQPALSPASHYISSNGSALVEHIAAVDPEGNLISYYYSDDNDWKAVNVSEKTNVQVAIEQPTSWTTDADGTLLENIAARMTDGHVIVFTWHSGADWEATNLSDQWGFYSVGPLTSWNAPAGSTVAEHVAFRTQDNHFVLYWRFARQKWSWVDVTNLTGQQIANAPTGWDMSSDTSVERVAAIDSNQHLILFTYGPSTNWSTKDVSAAASGQLVVGRVTAWDHNGVQYIAARTPNNHLVVFSYDPIDTTWWVQDVTGKTGIQIGADPTSWVRLSGEDLVVHIVAPDLNGQIYHFASPVGGDEWSTENVSAKVGVTSPYPFTAWFVFRDRKLTERLAAPNGESRLHVFTRPFQQDWSATDVSLRSSGRVIYAASPFAGIWVSKDYGATWQQSTRPQPAAQDMQVPGALISTQMLDVAVSPANRNLVFAAADREPRTDVASGAGIYRSTDGGQSWELKYQFHCGARTEATTQIVIAPDDPQRIYAAGGCAIARSTDGGQTWQPITVTTNLTERVWHLAVSGKTGPQPSDRMIVACGDGNLWVSPNDGSGWHHDDAASQEIYQGFCANTKWGHGTAAHILAMVPNQPSTVYLGFPNYANGPSYYHPQDHGEGPDGTFCNIPVVYDANGNNHYDTGELKIDGRLAISGTVLADDTRIKFRDLGDGGNTLDDDEPVVLDVNNNGAYDKDEPVYRQAENVAVGDALKDDPKLKYVDEGRQYGKRGCGESSLWKGDLNDVAKQANQKRGLWRQVPGPPVYFGDSLTNSGGMYVFTHALEQGYLVFFADGDTLNVSVGEPTISGWHRLDGLDASEAHHRNQDFVHNYVHVDPQGFAVAPDFSVTLKQVSDQRFPYNQNSEVEGDKCSGRIWASNDGGVYSNDNCSLEEKRWQPAFSGLNTLIALNVAGTTSLDYQPALYFGTADNDDFYSMNDGRSWKDALGSCGDCDTWFSDPYWVKRVMRLDPRHNNDKGTFTLFTNPGQGRPDAGNGSHLKEINYLDNVRPYAISGMVLRGYRPVIQTLPTETAPADGDYVTIQAVATNEHYVLRANNSLSSTGFVRQGSQIPPRPNNTDNTPRDLWMQAGGGHADPYFYVSDGVHLWRRQSSASSWDEIVPNKTVNLAVRFFVNPYDASLVYVLSDSGVFISTNHGDDWERDQSLEQSVTGNYSWEYTCWGEGHCPLNDMAFDPTQPGRRFAAGLAGVFFTADGRHWARLLDTRAVPAHPLGLWFDPVSRPNDQTLYVANYGRGILRLHPIPSTQPDLPSPPPTPSPTPIPTPTPTPEGESRSLLPNGGFEDNMLGWLFSGNANIEQGTAHNGKVSVRLGHESSRMDEVSRPVLIPCDAQKAILSYYWLIASEDNLPALDTLDVIVTGENRSSTLQALNENTIHSRWMRAEFDVSEFRCQSLTLTFRSVQNSGELTSFYIDDVQVVSYKGR